jgi:serine/threonine protein phosphatase PrpC
MEDEFFLSLDGDFAAVFDGHGGAAVSRYLRKNLYANVQAFLPVLTTATAPPVVNHPNNNNKREEVLWTTTNNDNDNDTTTISPIKQQRPTVQDYEDALESALDKVDREVQRISHWSYQGSTAVAIWLHEEPQPRSSSTSSSSSSETNENNENDNNDNTPIIQRTIIAANVGDSRAVLCRNGTAWDLTRDHKPNDPYEKSRIEELGGAVVWCGDSDKMGEPILERGIYRVNGNLALSRAIGDRSERPSVTADPEIISAPIQDDDDFIILATDGLWDVMDSNDAVDLVQTLREAGHDLHKISTLVVEEALRRGTYDNITVVIIWLQRKHQQITKSS